MNFLSRVADFLLNHAAIALVVSVGLAIGAVRMRPGFPAHGVSLEGSYEALAHCWVSACLAGPIVFWLAMARLRRPRLPWEENRFDDFNALAHVSFWSAIVLTFGVEGVLFVVQVVLAK